jgi:NADH-quinone oxidoreductase subunit L
MTVPLIVLAVLSTIGGFIGVPYALSSVFTDKDVNVLEHTLEPAVAQIPTGPAGVGETHGEPASPATTEPGALAQGSETHAPEATAAHATHSAEEISAERMLALVSVIIAALGLGIGWYVYRRRPLLQMPRLLENKYYVDEIYDATLIKPIAAGSREGLWKIVDMGVIDGVLHTIGETVTEAGQLARHLQAGFVRGYAAIILIGALILIGLFGYLGFR